MGRKWAKSGLCKLLILRELRVARFGYLRSRESYVHGTLFVTGVLSGLPLKLTWGAGPSGGCVGTSQA
jgi:hypothetical protein